MLPTQNYNQITLMSNPLKTRPHKIKPLLHVKLHDFMIKAWALMFIVQAEIGKHRSLINTNNTSQWKPIKIH